MGVTQPGLLSRVLPLQKANILLRDSHTRTPGRTTATVCTPTTKPEGRCGDTGPAEAQPCLRCNWARAGAQNGAPERHV